LIALLQDWNDDAANRLFTDNVARDESYDRRAAEAGRWLAACGGALQLERIVVESPTSCVLVVGHPGGSLHIDLLLSPLRPPRVQQYGFELVAP
jgi:hypothetical protein